MVESGTGRVLRTLGCAFRILALALGLAFIVGAIYQGYLFQRDIYGCRSEPKWLRWPKRGGYTSSGNSSGSGADYTCEVKPWARLTM